MLTSYSVVCVFLLAVLVVRSLVWTKQFLDCLPAGSSDPSIQYGDVPRAVVVLPVRGKDPFLDKCIESLLNQDYPNYILRIIIDSEFDPSVQTIETAVNLYSQDRVQVAYL